MLSSTTSSTGTPMARVSCSDVAFILDVLDDRDQDAGIALPQKNAFDIGDWIPRDEILDLAIVIGQHHDGNIQPGLLHLARQLRRVHVADREVGYDQVELRASGPAPPLRRRKKHA